MLVTRSYPALWEPKGCSLPGSSVHGISPGKNTGVGCHAFLWVIFPAQELNPGLLHCQQILHHLSHRWSHLSGHSSDIPRQWPQLVAFLSLHFPPTSTLVHQSVQLSSVAQSCPTLCNPMDCSTPGLPVHHQLPEFTQTHVHWVADAIQQFHPLSSPSPPAFNLSQHQGLCQWVSSSHQVAKVLELQLQHQSFQWTPRTDVL